MSDLNRSDQAYYKLKKQYYKAKKGELICKRLLKLYLILYILPQ